MTLLHLLPVSLLIAWLWATPLLGSPLQLPVAPSTHPVALRPYTPEWIATLERLRNTFGGACEDDTPCPVEIPPFECQDYEDDDADGVVKDVWSLRPRDVKAVIALGDSISAGFGMLSGRPPVATILEYRGKAFSSGADDNDHTIANFLRIYHEGGKPVEGAPSGVTLPLAHQKELNYAVSGSFSDDLPSQASRLTNGLLKLRYHHLRGEYKLATIFVGANNICQSCSPVDAERQRADPDAFERDIRDTMERLRTGVGKVFVNLVGLFNVSNVYLAAQEDPYCRLIFDRANMALCPCATTSNETRAHGDALTVEYNRRLQRIAADYGPGRSRDFAVVYQPALEELNPEKHGQKFLSRFDCFHPNRCAHKVMALGIWNNMFTPAGRKERVGAEDELKVVCPTKKDHIQ